MVKDVNLPYLSKKSRGGRVYWYFRRGEKYVPLPGNPDSREFQARYWEIRSGTLRPQIKTTFEALIVSYYRSPAFTSKADGTRREYRRTLELIREKNGSADFTKLRRRDVIAARDRYADTWRKGNAMVEMLSILSRHAIDLEWITANPAHGVEKLKGGEYEPWPEDKLRAFENYCRNNALEWELTAFMLATQTGQRIGDVLKMEWSQFDGSFIEVEQEKTGARLWVACPAALKDYLASLPRSGRFIIAQNLTRGLSKRALQNRVQVVRDAINARAYVIHGWRYNAAVALADAGCSDSEIQAVTGHKTLSMVQKYRSQANQKRLSATAQARRNGPKM